MSTYTLPSAAQRAEDHRRYAHRLDYRARAEARRADSCYRLARSLRRQAAELTCRRHLWEPGYTPAGLEREARSWTRIGDLELRASWRATDDARFYRGLARRAEGDVMAATYGSKYHATRRLDIAEVAKLVRADVKAAQAGGELPPGLGYTVRIERFAGGTAIDVTVTGLADGEHFTTDELSGRTVLTPQAQQIEERLKTLMDAYNYDNSGDRDDYHEGRFYAGVAIQADDDARR